MEDVFLSIIQSPNTPCEMLSCNKSVARCQSWLFSVAVTIAPKVTTFVYNCSAVFMQAWPCSEPIQNMHCLRSPRVASEQHLVEWSAPSCPGILSSRSKRQNMSWSLQAEVSCMVRIANSGFNPAAQELAAALNVCLQDCAREKRNRDKEREQGGEYDDLAGSIESA